MAHPVVISICVWQSTSEYDIITTCSRRTLAECVLKRSERSFLLSAAAVWMEYVQREVGERAGNTKPTTHHRWIAWHAACGSQSSRVASWTTRLWRTNAARSTRPTCWQQAISTTSNYKHFLISYASDSREFETPQKYTLCLETFAILNILAVCISHYHASYRSVWLVTTLCSEKEYPLTFSFISPWKMLRFPQNFQGMFRRKLVFHQYKSYIFFATGDIMLTSYCCVFFWTQCIIMMGLKEAVNWFTDMDNILHCFIQQWIHQWIVLPRLSGRKHQMPGKKCQIFNSTMHDKNINYCQINRKNETTIESGKLKAK